MKRKEPDCVVDGTFAEKWKEILIERYKKAICQRPECLEEWKELRFGTNEKDSIKDYILECPSNDYKDTMDFTLYHCKCHRLVLYGKNDVECRECGTIMCQGCSDTLMKSPDSSDSEDYEGSLCKECEKENTKEIEEKKLKKKRLVFTACAVDVKTNRVVAKTCLFDGIKCNEIESIDLTMNKESKDENNKDDTQTVNKLCQFIEDSVDHAEEEDGQNLVLVFANKCTQMLHINSILGPSDYCTLPKTPKSNKWLTVIDIIDVNRAVLGVKGMKCKPWEHDVSPIKYYKKNATPLEHCNDILKSYESFLIKSSS